jgi:hypothetical protein
MAVAMDHNVVVVPAEGGEVVWVVRSALRFLGDVVGLEPVAGLASFSCAGVSVAVEEESSEFEWDGAGSGSYRQGRSVVVAGEDFDLAVTENLFEGERPHPWSGINGGSAFLIAVGCQFGVDEDRHSWGGDITFRIGPVKGVLCDRNEGVGVTLRAGCLHPVGEPGELVDPFGQRLLDDKSIGAGKLTPKSLGASIEGGLHCEKSLPEGLLFVSACVAPVAGDHPAHPGHIPAPGSVDQLSVGPRGM